MRHLWLAACGRIDLDVAAKAFWMAAFGQQVTPDQLEDMHPLRRVQRPPPSAEEAKAVAGFGMNLLQQGLAELNRMRGK